ncbi:ABC transporter ATP-binding protein [Streptomyces sp. NPDC008001]|uniref:ABC transporter ATP-binding protein n=1 Tax=Streptomyces sp. NPDC008001 TaxID=3364804 RepID=UPI0036EDB3C1
MSPDDTRTPVLEVTDLVHTYPTKPPTEVLRGIGFSAHQGEILGVLGINGAGKTTLIKAISTLLYPSGGSVRVDGYDVVRQARQVRDRISVVLGGDRGLYNRLSVLENLRFFASLHGIRRGLQQRCRDALEQVQLEQYASRRVETLSKGMRQRLNLAIGLISVPRLLLLDEPTVGLDIFEARRVRETVAHLAQQGTTVLLTSHYPMDIDQLATRIILVEKGLISCDMPADRFRRQVGHIAEIRLSGTGTGPDTAAFEGLTLESSGGQWTATLRVRSWEPAVFDCLSTILRSTAVTDLHVHPVGVETILHSLAGASAR